MTSTLGLDLELADHYATSIADLDFQIIGLLDRRRDTAHSLRTLRVNAGLPRIDLRDERETVERYRRILGDRAATIAHAIRELCK